MRGRTGRDAGSGTVLVLALVAVVLVLVAATGMVARGSAARQGVQGAADLAALAAAGAVSLPAGVRWSGAAPTAGACELASAVAARNDAVVQRCAVFGNGVVTVTAARGTAVGTATASARAGPASARVPPPRQQVGQGRTGRGP